MSTSTQWDVFISHASEDKEEFVRPLANRLRDLGLRVWYDEFSLRLGDSLSRSIDEGLARSQFGVVVLSPDFFRKEWPQRELDGLVAKQISGGKPILPLWHRIARAEIVVHSPTLADRVALETSGGPELVAQKILEVVRPVPLRSIEIAAVTLRHLQHEIIAPLDAVVAHVEWLRRHFLPQLSLGDLDSRRLQSKLADIRQNVALVDVVVHMMAPVREDERPELEALVVLDELQAIRETLTHEAKRKRVELRIDCSSEHKVSADREQLRRVFYALLSNCVKYVDPKAPPHWCRVTASESGGNTAVLFADNGIGVVEGEEERIFDRFRRGSNAPGVSPVGAGLGLAFARHAVSTMGGSLVLARRKGPTEFVLTLPRGE